MGRGRRTEPQIDAGHLRASFTIGANSGALIRTAWARGDLIGQSATYRDPDGVLRVRFRYRGARRTMTAAKMAWAVHYGELPRGQVQTIDDAADLRAANLTVVPACSHKAQSAAGKASSLERRRTFDAALLAALAANEGAGVGQLARITGSSESCISTKLSKPAERDLVVSPQCVPGRAWALTDQGREIVMAGKPLLDDLDHNILRALALTAMGVTKLSRRVEVCALTARRRVNILIGNGLVFADPRRFYMLTPAGREALGEAPVVSRWVDPERIKASVAKDVTERLYVPEQTAEQRSYAGKMARAAAKRNKSQPFNGGGYFERMAS